MSLKEIKTRIASVKSTRQITSAMKMVASAKLHKAQGRVEHMLPYRNRLVGIVTDFLHARDEMSEVRSPYVDAPAEVRRVAVVVCSSNTSLCGAFNANVLRLADRCLARYEHLGRDAVALYAVGRKAEEHLRRQGYTLQGTFRTLADKPAYDEAARLAERLMHDFATGTVNRVELIYTRFRSLGSQTPVQETFLPMNLAQIGQGEQTADAAGSNDLAAPAAAADRYRRDYIVEPSPAELLAALIPKVLTQQMYTVMLSANTAEHAARMLAMQTATDNANELIQELTRQYNKMRQQTITSELLDIIGGSFS